MSWDSQSAAALITALRRRRHDLTEVEVKSAAAGVPALGPTLCAFGNMPEGGTIILGLDESRGFAPTGLTEVSALEQAVAAIKAEVDIEVAASVGILTQEQVDRLKAAGVHRYNHNLETARSFFPNVVTTHTWESRRETLRMVAAAGMEVCSGGILGMGESLEQRAEFASDLAELNPTEVPMNFLDPRPGTPFADKEVMATADALRAIGAFRLALPKTILRFAGGRELTLGDLGTEQGLLGGINAMIVGNYLTTLGRPMENDLDMLDKLRIPLKVLTTSV